MTGLGIIMSIIVGGLAGFIAEKIMKSDMGLIANIALGILGAVVLNAILGALGYITDGGAIAQCIVAIVGACLLIGLWRLIKRK